MKNKVKKFTSIFISVEVLFPRSLAKMYFRVLGFLTEVKNFEDKQLIISLLLYLYLSLRLKAEIESEVFNF